MAYRPSVSRLPEKDKQRICSFIADRQGLKSREIANQLGIDKRNLNQFLYYEGKHHWGLYVRNWRWYHSGERQIPLPLISTNGVLGPTQETSSDPGTEAIQDWNEVPTNDEAGSGRQGRPRSPSPRVIFALIVVAIPVVMLVVVMLTR